ncbi:hypothetical protein D3C81_1772110 [compost metagenome]
MRHRQGRVAANGVPLVEPVDGFLDRAVVAADAQVLGIAELFEGKAAIDLRVIDAGNGLQAVGEQLASVKAGRCLLFVPDHQVELAFLEQVEVVLRAQWLDGQLDARCCLAQALHQSW